VEGGRITLVVGATEIIEARSTHLVTKSNMLIEASYKLSVVEHKIILCLASNISPSDSDFKTYTLPIKEFTNLLGLKGTPKYTELRQITKSLMQKVFELRIDKKVIQVAWLSYVAYNETEGTIDIRFDPFLKPYLLQLRKEFTSYKLENIIKLKSSYAIRIYELLKQYERLHERTFLLVDLRKMLGAQDIYPAYGNFKQRVLVPAQKEIKKRTDISFEIEEIKTGRRVEKIKFIISSIKKKSIEQLELFDERLEEFKAPNSFYATVKKMGLNQGIHLPDEILKMWEKYGQSNVISQLVKIQHRKDIENKIGYITTVLKLSAASDEAAATTDNEVLLAHLVSKFRKSKEALPEWIVNDDAIKEIEKQKNVSTEIATQLFGDIKQKLYEILQIAIPDTTYSDENIKQKKKELEERLKKYKK
jgi:plasmid replication initiation protein